MKPDKVGHLPGGVFHRAIPSPHYTRRWSSTTCGFLVVVALIGVTSAAAELSLLDRLPHVKKKVEAKETLTIVGLGDSITTYYGNHSRNSGYYPVPPDVSYYGVFASYLRLNFPGVETRVINKGIGGETADRGLKRVEKDVLSQNPDLVFVMYGANDGRGGRDMALFKKELREMVRTLQAAGADVVLVAPTMSLADLTWLLPCRQEVLSLAETAGCPVVDGTLALWPVDEDVHTMLDVFRYLAMQFPPNGDDIHPAFAGQFQMGRRIWTQLTAPPVQPRLSFSLSQTLAIPGPSPLRLRVDNISGKPLSCAVQPFFPAEMPMKETTCEELDLPNKAKGKLRCLAPQTIKLEPGASTSLEWQLELPGPDGFLSEPSPLAWLGGKSHVGVAVFAEERNDVFLVRPAPQPLAVSIIGPRRVETAEAALAVRIENRSTEPFEGEWRFIGDDAWRSVSIAASAVVELPFTLPLPPDTSKTLRVRKGVVAKAKGGDAVRAIDAVTIEAAPCVNAVEGNATIDGDLTDWSTATWHEFKAGTADAAFALSQENDVLRVAMRAKDPLIEFQKPVIWTSDGFELYFDARADSELGTPGPLFQIGLFPPKDPKAALIVAPGTGAGGAKLGSITSAWHSTADGYAIETEIPVKLFSPNGLTNGQVIGFSAACDNVSQQGTNRTQHQWAGTNANFATPVDHAFLRWGAGPALWRIRYER